SRPTFFNLLSRSRRRRSASPAIAEEAEQPPDRTPQLVTGDDRVDVAEAEVLLGAPELLGQLLPRRLLDDPRAGERHQRSGLGEQDVAERREARKHTSRRRMGEHRDESAARVAE